MEKVENIIGGETLQDNDSVPFPDGYSLKIFPSLNHVVYIFKDPNGHDSGKYNYVEPLMMTEQGQVGREIRKHLNPDGRLTLEAVRKDFENVKKLLNELYQLHNIRKDKESEEARLRKEAEEKQNIRDGLNVLELKEQPLIYIASLTSWLTAGERANILLTFCAYASQVVLSNPINVIALGEGGSGKTHIEEVALSYIPEDLVLHDKKISEPALFRRSEIDPYFYDGKIVNFGDLGGKSSQDFIMEVKDLLKELQSDGRLSKHIMVPAGGGMFDFKELTLYGKPCSTYTTVPGYEFDDQEMSRSIFITPRMDNKAVFHARKKVLELKTGKTYKQYKCYEKEAEVIKHVLLLIKERMKEIEIVNPYTESIINFLGESEYFKRDFDKYNGILKTITAINGFNRQTYDIDGDRILFTNLDDIQIFISLLEAYHESVSVNISPKATEVLEDIRKNLSYWKDHGQISDLGFTTGDYVELGTVHISKRSIQTYFGELNRAGFIKAVDKIGRANVYTLSGRAHKSKMDTLLTLSKEQRTLIYNELGPEALRFIEEDAMHDGLSIMNQDETVKVPGWDKFDH